MHGLSSRLELGQGCGLGLSGQGADIAPARNLLSGATTLATMLWLR